MARIWTATVTALGASKLLSHIPSRQCLAGAELKALRLRAGLTQAALARTAGIGRQAVGYWEAKATLPRRSSALGRMCRALGLPDLPYQYAHARGWGLSPFTALDAWTVQRLAAELARIATREAARKARRRVMCGAKTRKDVPCRNLSEPGRQRCKFHGGKSTGPRTVEGRARVAQAQRRRWELHKSIQNN